jgi:hypothetical protein
MTTLEFLQRRIDTMRAAHESGIPTLSEAAQRVYMACFAVFAPRADERQHTALRHYARSTLKPF